MSKKRQPIFDLDDEEQELSDSFDRGEWKGTKKLKQEIDSAKEAATNYFREKKKIQASRYAHEKFWPSCPQNLFASRDLY